MSGHGDLLAAWPPLPTSPGQAEQQMREFLSKWREMHLMRGAKQEVKHPGERAVEQWMARVVGQTRRNMVLGMTARKFGEDDAEELAPVLAGTSDEARLVDVAHEVGECDRFIDLIDEAANIVALSGFEESAKKWREELREVGAQTARKFGMDDAKRAIPVLALAGDYRHLPSMIRECGTADELIARAGKGALGTDQEPAPSPRV